MRWDVIAYIFIAAVLYMGATVGGMWIHNRLRHPMQDTAPQRELLELGHRRQMELHEAQQSSERRDMRNRALIQAMFTECSTISEIGQRTDNVEMMRESLMKMVAFRTQLQEQEGVQILG